MKELFLKYSMDRMEKEKSHIRNILYEEFGIHCLKQKIDIVYNRELPYTIIVNKKRKFLYKSNIAKRTPNIESFETIKNDFENCFKSILLPNILNESLNFYEVEYLNDTDYRVLTLNDLNVFRKQTNKLKIFNYCQTISGNDYCFVDFDLQNFFYNIHTHEIYLTYFGDMDKINLFNPNILSIDNPNNRSTFFIVQNVDLPQFNLSDEEYTSLISDSFANYEIKFIK